MACFQLLYILHHSTLSSCVLSRIGLNLTFTINLLVLLLLYLLLPEITFFINATRKFIDYRSFKKLTKMQVLGLTLTLLYNTN